MALHLWIAWAVWFVLMAFCLALVWSLAYEQRGRSRRSAWIVRIFVLASGITIATASALLVLLLIPYGLWLATALGIVWFLSMVVSVAGLWARRLARKHTVGQSPHVGYWCHWCGKPLSPAARFCRFCGTQITE